MKAAIRHAVCSLLVALPLAAADPAKDFDYLLGDWEFTSVSQEWGPGRGLWSAAKLPEGQILDEYRVTDEKGGTLYVTTTLRNYNEAKKVWDLVGADRGGGLRDSGTARRVGDEVHIEQTFGASGEKPSIWRIRYYDIRPDAFSWVADVSNDGGKTWAKGFLKIEARRVGPPRRLPALTKK